MISKQIYFTHGWILTNSERKREREYGAGSNGNEAVPYTQPTSTTPLFFCGGANHSTADDISILVLPTRGFIFEIIVYNY